MAYCTINEVVKNWNIKSIGVILPDGSDMLLKENGYTIEDAFIFAGRGLQFFYD